MSLKVKLQESVNEVITALENLKNDESVPKNIKAKIDDIVAGLRDDSDVSSKVGKSLHEHSCIHSNTSMECVKYA